MSQSQFPRPWQPLAGSYDRAEYSRRWQFNSRDAGSTAAFAGVMAPIIAAAIGLLEYHAGQSGGHLGAGEATAAGASLFSVSLVCKVGVAFLKNYGTSVVHDIGTWFWERLIEPYTTWIMDEISKRLPGHHRRVRRRDRWNDHVEPEPQPRRDGPIARWRKRRQNRGDS